MSYYLNFNKEESNLFLLSTVNTTSLIWKLEFKPVIFLSLVIFTPCSIVLGLHSSFLHFFIKTLKRFLSHVCQLFLKIVIIDSAKLLFIY